jgi:hypothetical protein
LTLYYIRQTIDELQKNGGTVLSIPCGHGKTFSAIYIAAHLGPALIVTDQIAILDGWRADIKKFLGDNVPIGLIHGKTFDVEGKFIVLAMLQVRRRYVVDTSSTRCVWAQHRFYRPCRRAACRSTRRRFNASGSVSSTRCMWRVRARSRRCCR